VQPSFRLNGSGSACLRPRREADRGAAFFSPPLSNPGLRSPHLEGESQQPGRTAGEGMKGRT